MGQLQTYLPERGILARLALFCVMEENLISG